MSDPVTQAEIEDVLSSIRRLVSEDGRSAPRPVSAQRAEAQRDAGEAASLDLAKPTSRLVLTPALRVADEVSDRAQDDAEQPEVIATMDSDAALGAAEPAESASQAESHMDIEVAPELDPAEVLAFRPHDSVEDQTVVDSYTDAEPQADLEPSEALEEPITDAEEQLDTAPWRDPEATLFGAVEPSVEALVEAPEEETSQSSPQLDERVAEQNWDEVEPEVDQPVELDGSQRVSAVVQKIAELEAKVARSSGQWEPDGQSTDPYAGTNIETLEWQDHIDEDGEAEREEELTSRVPDGSEGGSEAGFDSGTLAEEAVTDAALDALDAGNGEESYLDEESLRELVAEIVRSELQGALGERITRNVRKLVRREIQRALAAQDLV
ncbi:hypothetical protein [Pseudophaeobacter sp. EL27]|uniref:hypothetical protein n=1 Tax=Pseudophaeobacter sp. EL27 TaxID=2107580 RepID=UPI000EFC125E|nr:hypothetical protein [Pseudophaeobacter sp. EL27]